MVTENITEGVRQVSQGIHEITLNTASDVSTIGQYRQIYSGVFYGLWVRSATGTVDAGRLSLYPATPDNDDTYPIRPGTILTSLDSCKPFKGLYARLNSSFTQARIWIFTEPRLFIPFFNVSLFAANTGTEMNGIPTNKELTTFGDRMKVSTTFLSAVTDNTTTALAGSATFTGTGRFTLMDTLVAVGSTAQNSYMTQETVVAAVAFADVAGTIRLQANIVSSGGTWRNFLDTAVVASTVTRQQQSALGMVSTRHQYVNGAGAQATFEFCTMSGASLP